MDAILQGLSGIFEVALIAGLGFFLARKGWFWENAAKDLTKLTMTVALPPLMIHSLYANFTHDALLEAAPDLVLPFVSIFASYLAGHVLASLLHISKGRRGIFICTCCIANAIFIGVPVNVALFGEASVPSCMLYYLANTTMFWALGAYLIIRDAGGEHRFTLKEMLLKLRTPPLMGFAAGVILLLANVPIPHFAMAGRFLLAPFCLFLLLPVIPVSEMSSKVFLMQAGMPAMTNMTILATAVGADADTRRRSTASRLSSVYSLCRFICICSREGAAPIRN